MGNVQRKLTRGPSQQIPSIELCDNPTLVAYQLIFPFFHNISALNAAERVAGSILQCVYEAATGVQPRFTHHALTFVDEPLANRRKRATIAEFIA
ncbi:MAG: hypothetical protein KGH65_03650 [Candidatus Micrarchaeota archaeon]|nr:hypothetical protein [Candidatus Micrarchaeota archaeon]